MTESPVTFITLEQLLEMKENQRPYVLLDVLSAESYANGHIPGAVNIPAAELAEKAAALLPDKNTTIVTYCARYMCHASTEAARTLQGLGYAHVLDYKAGLKGWQAGDLPLTKD